MDALTRLLVAVRDELVDVAEGALVLTACSGGPDSLALAAATARLAPPRGWRTGAIVIDHGWSAEASAAGRATAGVLTRLGLSPVEVIEVDTTPGSSISAGPRGSGPEGDARTARYHALDAAAQRFGAVAVLLGHTLDDQAETVLLGLGRGSGARSLAGMPRQRGLYRRPLLGLRRETTVAACAELGLSPWHDPANDDPRYARVRVRQLAGALQEALGPGLVLNLARTADLLREDADALGLAAAQLLDQARVASSGPVAGAGGLEPAGAGGLELEITVLVAAPAAVRRRALLAAAREVMSQLNAQPHGQPDGLVSLTRAHALALDELLTGAEGAEAHLPSGVIGRRACGRLLLATKLE